MRLAQYITLLVFTFSLFFADAQVVDTVTIDSAYKKQVFYNLNTGIVKTVNLNDWDIAFEVSGNLAGVLANHGKGVEVYRYKTKAIAQFALVDTAGMSTWSPSYNNTGDWVQGAFNRSKGPNAFDFGWGEYDFVNHFVVGDEVFVVRLGDGSVIKVAIDRLQSGVYYFRYANLNGSGFVSDSLLKSDFPNEEFGYYSFSAKSKKFIEPPSANWDLQFLYYASDLGNGNYALRAGVLDHKDITIRENRTQPRVQSTSAGLPGVGYEIIGNDWYKFAPGYRIYDSVSYFITDKSGADHKFYFEEFTGENTGHFIFRRGVYPWPLHVNVKKTDNSCFGCNDGTAKAVVVGGTPPYSYNWSTSATTDSISGLAPGTYYVTVTDVANATDIDTFTILPYDCSARSLAITKVQPICNGEQNGSLTVNLQNGIGPFTYNWSAGSTLSSQNGLGAGSTYAVTVTDAKNCQLIESNITLSEPTVLFSNKSLTDETCVNCNDGTAQLNPTGGVSPYTYAWSHGASTSTITGLNPGIYYSTITDASGCNRVDTFEITAYQCAFVFQNVQSSDPVCRNENNGSIVINHNGGQAPYLYNWSNSAVGPSNQNLMGGSYSLTLTDAKGCEIDTTINLLNPQTLSLSAVVQDESCNSCNNGEIILAASGEAPFTYNWSNGSQSQNLSNLSPGTYGLTLTDDFGCEIDTQFTIAPYVCNLAITGFNTVDLLCAGGQTGTAEVQFTGGKPVYFYQWSNGAATRTAQNLTAGKYDVTVNDARGCSAISSVTINQPTPLDIQFTIQDETCPSCNDGSITTTLNGGTPIYSYGWAHGPTSQNISNLSPGNYTFSVTDQNGCTKSKMAQIDPFGCSLVIDSVSITEILCFGATSGSLEAWVSGGNGVVNYNWSNGITTPQNLSLGAGTYDVTVTDQIGCQAQTSALLTQPSKITTSVSGNDETCFNCMDGDAQVVASGGTGNLIYIWSHGPNTPAVTNLGGGNYTVEVRDDNNCSVFDNITIKGFTCSLTVSTSNVKSPKCYAGVDGEISLAVSGAQGTIYYNWSHGPNTSIVTGLVAQNYQVSVYDQKGCNVVKVITVPNGDSIGIANIITDESCNNCDDGSISVTGNGGSGPYSYTWSNSSNASFISSLSPSIYTVTVTDNKGCASISTYQIEPYQCQLAFGNISVSNPSCSGRLDGEINVILNNAIAPVNYNWSNSASGGLNSGLSKGGYGLTITDGKNCQLDSNFTLVEPALLTNTLSKVDESCLNCQNGKVFPNSQGGTPSYTYLWSNGKSSDSITDLSPGKYFVTVTDANNCRAYDSVEINPFVCNFTYGQINILAPDCFGDSNGTIEIIPQGGNQPYTYQWSNNDQTAKADSLASGAYQVQISDMNGCALDTTIFLSQPSKLISNILVVDESCLNCEDGSLFVSGTGGTKPYTFLWDDFSTQTTRENLGTGWYYVTTTDKNGCSIQDSAFVDMNVAVKDFNIDSEIRILPNPNNGQFLMELPNGIAHLKIAIYNLHGEIVHEETVNGMPTHINVNLNYLPSGQYLVTYGIGDRMVKPNSFIIQK